MQSSGQGRLDQGGRVGFIANMSTKELAHAAIDALPDDATLQDAAEKLALLAALDKSRDTVKTGHWKTQADVEKLLPRMMSPLVQSR